MDFIKPKPPPQSKGIEDILCGVFDCGGIQCVDCILSHENWKEASEADQRAMVVEWLEWVKACNMLQKGGKDGNSSSDNQS